MAETKPPKKEDEPQDFGHVPMTEEFDRAKWTLPPLGIVAIALLALAIVAGLLGWWQQPKPQAAGSVEEAFGVATPDGKTLATIKVTVSHVGKGKPLYVKKVAATLKTADGEFTDDAASAEDFERYFQGFPALKEHSLMPLRPETKVPAGLEAKGSIIVLFPVTVEQFEARKGLEVRIDLYDQKPLILQL